MGRGRVCFFLYYVAGGPSRARRHPGIRAVGKGISMTLYFVVGLSAVVGLGVAAQWAASRLRIPSILLLLTFGIAAGPLTGLLDPDKIFGPLLLPVVSLSVAVVLFEGGLSLKLRELRQIGGDLLRLTTVGVLVAWLLTAAAARYVLGFDWPLAALLGAILVVTGPTVIGPLLRHLRLGGRVGAVLKWEGIVIDPLGAMLAVLVFVVASAEGRHGITLEVFANLGRTALIGGGLGALGAAFLIVPLSRYWVADQLQGAVTLATVFAVFALSDYLQAESGLLAVTVMGVGLANQRRVAVRHLVEFKEHLSVLLISCLFIILAARLRREDLLGLDVRSGLFLAALVVVVRPASVLLATAGSKMTWREKAFLCWMAPRGIVAAAVSSVFALEMAGAGYAQAERMPPVVFLVIIGTVALYGLSAAPLARRLKLAKPDAQGVLFVGASPLARELAAALSAEKCPVLLADSNWGNVSAARLAGLPTYYGSILGNHAFENIDFGDFGRLLAVTPNDEVNSLACLRFIEVFGRRDVYQLPFGAAGGRREAVSLEQRGRLLFGPERTHADLAARLQDGLAVKATRLTQEFDYAGFRALHGDDALPLFLIKETGEVAIFTVDAAEPAPQPGQTLISLTRATAAG